MDSEGSRANGGPDAGFFACTAQRRSPSQNGGDALRQVAVGDGRERPGSDNASWDIDSAGQRRKSLSRERQDLIQREYCSVLENIAQFSLSRAQQRQKLCTTVFEYHFDRILERGKLQSKHGIIDSEDSV